MRVSPLLIRIALVLQLGAAAAWAQSGPIIDVQKEADRRIAVGIDKYPLISAEEVGSPPGDVLAFDLELSGWFQAVRPGMLPPRTINDWQRRGAEVLIEMETERGSLTASVRDVGTGDILFSRSYPAGRGDRLRDRVHAFADDVVLSLTGERGLAATRVLCEWDPGDGKRIVTMGIDGYGLRELTGDTALELCPRWSPDGTRACYTSYQDRYPDVYVHDLVVGSRQKVAAYEGLNAQGDLSPDGTQLVLVLSWDGDPDIYSKDLTSGSIRRLTRDSGTEASPCWSPDGKRVAFVSDRSGGPQIYVMDADGTGSQRVTVRGSYNTAPDWSPDGTQIAYCALQSNGFQIQVIDLESRQTTTVTELGGCEDPCFSPDGRSILYSRKAGGRTDLFITSLNERRTLRVTRGSGLYTAPDWSPLP
ncbi:MAG: protein TolB [Gemmatimonadota bacterium]|nr:MAG: protein TolB [Gemmatimonadota bacterium]